MMLCREAIRMSIRISTEEFIKTKVNTDLKELSALPDLINAGDIDAAEKCYADFVRKSLKPELFFKVPVPEQENTWKRPCETFRDVYEKLRHGEVMSCNFSYDFGTPEGIMWESNPTPNDYYEWPWQLNRHHEFIALAKLYRDTGDIEIARLFIRLWRSWRTQCDCPENARFYETWAFRTIEIGIRMRYSWHFALHAFYNSGVFTDHDICDYFASMWENADRVYRIHSGAGNWMFMEMAGLYTTGLLYPWLSDAQKWKSYALNTVREQLVNQIYPDGFQLELATGYHGVVLENTLKIFSMSEAMGEPLPPELTRSMMPGFDMYVKLSAPDLYAPGLNDSSYAGVVPWCRKAADLFPEVPYYRYFASERETGTPPDFVNTYMPYSGMAVFRDNWGTDSQWAFFESAPFGIGHQHEDKLSFLLFAYGKRLLADTGVFIYDRSEMRKYVLSARSHNTVLVDGEGQNRRGRYRWKQEEREKLSDLKVVFADDYDAAYGIYDEGFGAQYIDVTHRRSVIKVKNHPFGLKTFYLVIDRLTANDGMEHTYSAHWQLENVPFSVSAGLREERDTNGVADEYSGPKRCGAVITADYGDGVTLTLLSGDNYSVTTGSFSPFIGWRTPDVPAPAIDFSACGFCARIVTMLYPSDEGCLVKAVLSSRDVDNTAIKIVLKDGRTVELKEPFE